MDGWVVGDWGGGLRGRRSRGLLHSEPGSRPAWAVVVSGRVRIADVLAQPPDYAKTAKVQDLLLAVPKIGPSRVARFLSRCRIAPSKTVGGMTERQRGELIELFRR